MLGFALFLLIVNIFIVFVSRHGFRSLIQPSHIYIIGKLPVSARLVKHELIRNGFDYTHLYEFSCSDMTLRNILVNKWQLRDLTDSNEDPISFAKEKHPNWWPSDLSSAIRKYGQFNENSERYWSIWQMSEDGPLYVEVGRW